MALHPKTSEKFNFVDSDLTIESSDGVRFLLHRKNLETHTQVFPGAEFDTKGEITHLTESASILEIVFQFVYPVKQPRLHGCSLGTVLAVAEAVQKYQIFSAVHICETRLKELVAEDPVLILVHALRHYEDYDESLVNKAALATSRMEVYPVLEKMVEAGIDQRLMLAWAKYQRKWDDMFAELRDILDAIQPINSCQTPGGCCNNCRSALIAWTQSLQTKPNLPTLEASLADPMFLAVHVLAPQYPRCTTCNININYCIHRDGLISACRNKVANMPQLSSFCSPSNTTVTNT